MPGALTRRETEVMALLGEHLTHVEIADRLVVSVRTVESHVASARRKLGIDGHRALVRYAAEHRPRAARIPTSLTPFVGRADECAALADAVRGQRLVSLVGTGGVGKTRLALKVAGVLVEEYAGRVWFVDLVPVTDGAGVAATVVTACQVGHLPGRLPEDVLARGLGGPAGLLVLDNCEHLLDPVALLVERLLGECPRLHVLLTSRARLALPFERVHQVRGLDPESDAVELFERRARDAGAQPLDADGRRRAAAVCAAVGGLALAIELAAVRLPALGLEGLEAGLTGQVDLLVGGARLSPRQRSVAETLDWSVRLVDARARAVLTRVCCFAGPFDAAAAAWVAGFGEIDEAEVGSALGTLVEHSLVLPLGSRWRLLEPVRQYAVGRMGAADEPARLRHLRWTSDRMSSSGSGAGDEAVLELADEARAAVGWAAALPERRTEAGELCASLAELLFAHGAVREAGLAFEQAAALTGGPAARADLLRDASSVARCRVLGEEAIRLDLLALDAARETGDDGMLAGALASVAEVILRFQGMFSGPPPREVARGVVDELEELAPSQSAAYAATHLVRTWSLDPPGPGAEATAEEAVEAARLSGDPVSVSAALDVLTFVQVMVGGLAAADSSAQVRLSVLDGLPARPAVALEVKDALHMSVQLGCATGDLARATDEARRHWALPFLREQRDLALEPFLLPAALAGHADELFEAAEQFVEDWEASGRPVAPGRVPGPYAVAVTHAMHGHDEESRRWFAVVAAMRDRPLAGAGRGTGYSVALDALLLLHRDEPDRALRLLTSVLVEEAAEWYSRLFSWWTAALAAEAAVLAGAPEAQGLLAEAERTCARSELLSLVVRRARALAAGDRAAAAAMAARFAELGTPYQQERTRTLTGQPTP